MIRSKPGMGREIIFPSTKTSFPRKTWLTRHAAKVRK